MSVSFRQVFHIFSLEFDEDLMASVCCIFIFDSVIAKSDKKEFLFYDFLALNFLPKNIFYLRTRSSFNFKLEFPK